VRVGRNSVLPNNELGGYSPEQTPGSPVSLTHVDAMLRIIIFSALLLASACDALDPERSAQTFRETDAFGKAFVLDLHSKGFAGVRDRIDPTALHHFAPSEMRPIRQALPVTIDSIVIADTVDFQYESGVVNATVPYRVMGSGRSTLITLGLSERGGVRTVNTIWSGTDEGP
jgi:hypothetical protein